MRSAQLNRKYVMDQMHDATGRIALAAQAIEPKSDDEYSKDQRVDDAVALRKAFKELEVSFSKTGGFILKT